MNSVLAIVSVDRISISVTKILFHVDNTGLMLHAECNCSFIAAVLISYHNDPKIGRQEETKLKKIYIHVSTPIPGGKEKDNSTSHHQKSNTT